MNPVYHYPPELLNLLVNAFPLLFRGKKNVITFYCGVGVPNGTLVDLQEKAARNRQAINTAIIDKNRFHLRARLP